MKSLKEVNWSKAPEGATHYNAKRSCPWLKETPASYFAKDKKVWVKYGSNEFAMIDLRNAVKRPQEWDGSGLPPIGTVCEYYSSDGDVWRKCEIVAYYLANVVAIDLFYSTAICLRIELFRPIKTPEQIAEEDRLHAIDEMLDFVVPCITYRNLIGALYDAGYRKQGA